MLPSVSLRISEHLSTVLVREMERLSEPSIENNLVQRSKSEPIRAPLLSVHLTCREQLAFLSCGASL